MEVRDIFSQSRFPRTWLLAQRVIGGNPTKKRIAMRHYANERCVLEIGCSVGNVSEAFREEEDILFTGVDIDEDAISIARQRFHKWEQFEFLCQTIDSLDVSSRDYEYIIVAAMLHHIDDEEALRVLSRVSAMGRSGAKIIIYEPDSLTRDSSKFMRLFYRYFERGEFLRTPRELTELATNAGLEILDSYEERVAPQVVPRRFRSKTTVLVCRSGG